MNPRDALHQQELLLSACRYNRQMARYVDSVAEDIHNKQNGPSVVNERGETIAAQALAQLLERAETFYVSADMAAVAEAASHGLGELDRFTHDMWPSDWGFLLFQQGWVIVDVWGRNLPVNAIAWQRRSFNGAAGTMVWEFAMLGVEGDDMAAAMGPEQEQELAIRLGSRLQLASTRWIADDMRVGPPTFDIDVEEYQKNLRKDIEDGLPAQYQASTAMPSTANASRLVMSLLLLMGQTIAAKEKVDLRPKNPKRARRMKVPGQVTIIRLRHEAAAREPGETQVEWQHRWLVRGHWRWQPCGPNYPMAVEISPGEFKARIYIAPFVKGPEGAPFKQTKKVNALVR